MQTLMSVPRGLTCVSITVTTTSAPTPAAVMMDLDSMLMDLLAMVSTMLDLLRISILKENNMFYKLCKLRRQEHCPLFRASLSSSEYRYLTFNNTVASDITITSLIMVHYRYQ